MRKPTPKSRLEKLLESGKLNPKQSFEAIKLLREWDEPKDEPKPVRPKPESPEEQERSRERSRAILDKALHPEPSQDSISQTKSPPDYCRLAVIEAEEKANEITSHAPEETTHEYEYQGLGRDGFGNLIPIYKLPDKTDKT